MASNSELAEASYLVGFDSIYANSDFSSKTLIHILLELPEIPQTVFLKMTLYDVETPTVFKDLCVDNSQEDIPAKAT